MNFDSEKYEVLTKTIAGETVTYRAFTGIRYCDRPKDEAFQTMNIFVPECYYHGESLNGYTLETAPVFFPNTVGGYMPGAVDEPGTLPWGPTAGIAPNSVFCALQHGYVTVSAGIRGRIQQNADGEFIGKAPALIVDYKAAVRFLHKFADVLPGNEDRIITNGTSAGGALSSLIGATGNHPDYEKYLEEIGAADASDAVFAASCYCPITNLDHADMAYEWEFSNVYDVHGMGVSMDEGGRPHFEPINAPLEEDRVLISKEEAALFPGYVNSLNLKDETGAPLTLDPDGNGSFKEYVEKVVLASADREMNEHIAEKYLNGVPQPYGEPEEKTWLQIQDGKAVSMDFEGWAQEITRMKKAPAFDDVDCTSPENDEFGDETGVNRHFAAYSAEHSRADGRKAEEAVIRMMNPMNYIEDEKAETTRFWRIRHGERDRDTSLAISAILTLKLQENGCSVDYQAPWERPHSGDYDLPELFAWIDRIVK